MTGIQCPRCGAELVETEESKRKQWVFPQYVCAKKCSGFYAYTSSVSRDGTKMLTKQGTKMIGHPS